MNDQTENPDESENSNNLDKDDIEMLKRMDQIENNLLRKLDYIKEGIKNAIDKVTLKESSLYPLPRLMFLYQKYSTLDKDNPIRTKGLAMYKELYGLARDKAISLGGDVSQYPVTLGEEN